MGKMQRDKGQRAEREVCKILEAQLGGAYKRNLQQTQEGGHDVLGLAGCALEVKHQEKFLITSWWEQTVVQARDVGALPVLFFRKNYLDWRVAIPTKALMNWTLTQFDDCYALMSVPQFCAFYSKLIIKGAICKDQKEQT